MSSAPSTSSRVRVDGKFLRLGPDKFYVKGVTYGPFAPNAAGVPFASIEQTARDFQLIRELGANTARVYAVPPKWVLEMAAEHQLKLLVDISWCQHLCFLDKAELRDEARQAVRNAVKSCAGHPAVLAFSVGNEIPPDVVRWSGARAIARFIDDMVAEAKQTDPGCLCTYANFPSTEYVRPESLDFLSYNVYLHDELAAKAYLARLQMVADSKPLLLSECGCDSLREGEQRKCQILKSQIETAFRTGLAGCVVFSFTDDWHRNGKPVTGWELGITDISRTPKPSYHAVRQAFNAAPLFPLPRKPRVSVVVANYNGARTLNLCLQSLGRLEYPDYEVLMVDDGSTDPSVEIAAHHTFVKIIRHDRNLGLSAARNTGIAHATGEIVAFTDSDCRADEHWLYYVVGDLLNSDFAGIGGHNFLPPDDSPVAAAVMSSPGGPAHVMLTDRQAEHIPGCNMAFFRQALVDIGGFDPIFTKAGDDVDLCWRLTQAGCKIGFSHGGFVWHYRRPKVRDYLKQQHGYGEAEALLARKHPEYFNALGGSIWRGRIYSQGMEGFALQRDVVYRGLFGSAGFQSLYAAPPSFSLMLVTSFEYWCIVVLPLFILSLTFHPLFLPSLISLLLPLAVGLLAGLHSSVPTQKRRWWTRPLIASLFLLQPIVRGYARYQGRLSSGLRAPEKRPGLDSIALRDSPMSLNEAEYWSEQRVDRLRWVEDILRRLELQSWPHRVDSGWSDHDVEIYGTRWCKLELTSVAEDHASGGQMLRIRLRARWSLRATALFLLLAALVLSIIGVLSRLYVWSWALLLVLPAAGWLLNRDKRNLQSMIAVFLDDLGKTWGFVKVSPRRPQAPAAPASPTGVPPTPFSDSAASTKAESQQVEAR